MFDISSRTSSSVFKSLPSSQTLTNKTLYLTTDHWPLTRWPVTLGRGDPPPRGDCQPYDDEILSDKKYPTTAFASPRNMVFYFTVSKNRLGQHFCFLLITAKRYQRHRKGNANFILRYLKVGWNGLPVTFPYSNFRNLRKFQMSSTRFCMSRRRNIK